MPKFTVTASRQTNQELDSWGKNSFAVTATDETGQEYQFFQNLKPPAMIKIGDVLEGSVSKAISKTTGKEYWKFTSDRPAGGNFQRTPRDIWGEERAKIPGFALSYAKDIMVAQMTQGEQRSSAQWFALADQAVEWFKKKHEELQQ